MNDPRLQHSINAQKLIRYICDQPITDQAIRAIKRLSEITIDSIKTHKNSLAEPQNSASNCD